MCLGVRLRKLTPRDFNELSSSDGGEISPSHGAGRRVLGAGADDVIGDRLSVPAR